VGAPKDGAEQPPLASFGGIHTVRELDSGRGMPRPADPGRPAAPTDDTSAEVDGAGMAAADRAAAADVAAVDGVATAAGTTAADGPATTDGKTAADGTTDADCMAIADGAGAIDGAGVMDRAAAAGGTTAPDNAARARGRVVTDAIGRVVRPSRAARLAAVVGACLCVAQVLPGAEADPSAAPDRVPAPPAATAAGPLIQPSPPRLPESASRSATNRAERAASRGTERRSRGPRTAGGRRVGSRSTGARILTEAARLSGRPYRWGAAGPWAFDCSGFTRWVYAKVGRSLPHKADAQQAYGRSVSRSAARPGDLVFFVSGSYAYHVGIYAGRGFMYDAPRPGRTIGKHRIWRSDYQVRRLLG
jgi:cell wall-associated NlpC family hydrolase